MARLFSRIATLGWSGPTLFWSIVRARRDRRFAASASRAKPNSLVTAEKKTRKSGAIGPLSRRNHSTLNLHAGQRVPLRHLGAGPTYAPRSSGSVNDVNQ
jgi:hypothetical protein